MKLPNVDESLVTEQKITEYLLSDTHPEGKGKAAFFTRFGFSVVSWETFAEALRQHAAQHEVSQTISTPHGTKYIIDGLLVTPDGRNPEIRAVWLIEEGSTIPRLITAHPLK